MIFYGLSIVQPYDRWTVVFLVTTAPTTLAGFPFSFHGITLALGVGIISTLRLARNYAATPDRKWKGFPTWTSSLWTNGSGSA